MGQYRALEVAKSYGLNCGVAFQNLLSDGTSLPSWLPFAFRWYSFTFHTGNGVVVTSVAWPGYSVRRFEFYPTDGSSFMLPLWLAYPSMHADSVGWRMGSGEVYRGLWHGWFASLYQSEQNHYRKQFPQPEDNGWQYFRYS
jgi:hypothetical protein